MRNRRFRSEYRRAAQERLEACVSRLIDRVIATPVTRGFYVGLDHALVMERKRRHGTLPTMADERRQMWEEIFAAFDGYLSRHPQASRTDAMAHVIANATASRFYISRDVALEIVMSGK